MNLFRRLVNGYRKVSSTMSMKWFWRSASKQQQKPMSVEEVAKMIPHSVHRYYQIRMLGKPFTEQDTKGLLWHGYIYEGKKYYEPQRK